MERRCATIPFFCFVASSMTRNRGLATGQRENCETLSATGLVCPYGCRVRMWTLASVARWRLASDAVAPMTAGMTRLPAKLCSIPARLWARSMSVSSMVTEASATRYVRSPAALFAETMMSACSRSSASLSVMSWAVRALLIIPTRNGAVSCRGEWALGFG